MIERQSQGSQLFLSGELTAAGLPELAAAMAAVPAGELVLELGEMDFDDADGSAMAGLTRLLRQRLASGEGLLLREPPQLVVHNLYRIGWHPHPLLRVEAMRQDEAYG